MVKPTISFKIRGAEEVAKKLANISKKAKAEVNKALTNAGYVVERNVKRRTPVVTGRLRSSIHTQPSRNFKALVGTNVSYAQAVEDGTKYFSGRKMFKKGLNDSKPQIKRIVSDGMSKAIKKV